MRRTRYGPSRQRGFVALIVLLIVVVIIGFAVSAMLRESSVSRTDRSAATPPAAAPGATGSPAPAPAPIERARAVEQTLRQQAVENERRIDQQVDGAAR